MHGLGGHRKGSLGVLGIGEMVLPGPYGIYVLSHIPTIAQETGPIKSGGGVWVDFPQRLALVL